MHPECDGFCPRCGAQSENDELECTLCRSELTGDNRFVVLCCHQALHLDCLVRSFNSCGVRCPFCQTDLTTLTRSSQFQQILGQPDASGSSAPWAFRWLCLKCSRTFNVNDVPTLSEATCPGSQQNAGAVLDVTTGNVRRVCTSCNLVVAVPDAVVERRDWFLSGQLSRLGPLYGWGSSSPSLPGKGPQSWLFCPLISLGLL